MAFVFRHIASGTLLRTLRSSIQTTTILSSSVFQQQGFFGSFRSYGAFQSPEQCVLQPQDEEIVALRHQFEAAKQSFLKIPHTLQEMPKMNPKGIYVNKNLRLDQLQVYGFDYDYTLAHYSADLQTLIYDLAKEFMVNELRYPEICMSFKYDPSFPIRGLYYDKSKGCLMKLDFFGSIEPDGCYFGRRRLSQSEIRDAYGTRHIGRDQARSLVGLMDFFCFSEVCSQWSIEAYFIGRNTHEVCDGKLCFANFNLLRYLCAQCKLKGRSWCKTQH